MCICVCTSYYIIPLRTGGGTSDTVLHTVRGVGGLGIRILTFDTKTSRYVEDRGLQVPTVLEHDYIPHSYNPDTCHRHTKLWGHSVPRPSFRTFRLLHKLTVLISNPRFFRMGIKNTQFLGDFGYSPRGLNLSGTISWVLAGYEIVFCWCPPPGP